MCLKGLLNFMWAGVDKGEAAGISRLGMRIEIPDGLYCHHHPNWTAARSAWRACRGRRSAIDCKKWPAIYARFTDGYDTEDLMNAHELLTVRQQGAELEKIALHSQGRRVAAQVRRHTHRMYGHWYCKTLN
jgi:hypothetical protein